MTWGFSDQFRSLLGAPLGVEKAVAVLGHSLWLYLALVLAANDRGLVIRSQERLAELLSVSESDIDRWLARLVAAKLIRRRSPSSFLVISLSFWPSSGHLSDVKARERSSETVALHREVPVSSSDVAAAAAATDVAENKNKQSSLSSRDGGPGEGNPLLGEARQVLGEAEAAEIRDLLDQHPVPLVRRALRRVQLTPATQIRKSKAALFRFLLAKFTDQHHDHPTHHPQP